MKSCDCAISSFVKASSLTNLSMCCRKKPQPAKRQKVFGCAIPPKMHRRAQSLDAVRPAPHSGQPEHSSRGVVQTQPATQDLSQPSSSRLTPHKGKGKEQEAPVLFPVPDHMRL